jgi:hypothetical protein
MEGASAPIPIKFHLSFHHQKFADEPLSCPWLWLCLSINKVQLTSNGICNGIDNRILLVTEEPISCLPPRLQVTSNNKIKCYYNNITFIIASNIYYPPMASLGSCILPKTILFFLYNPAFILHSFSHYFSNRMNIHAPDGEYTYS